jgi:hypothetical protein
MFDVVFSAGAFWQSDCRPVRGIFYSAVLLAAALVAGCSGERGLSCESGERYQGSRSVGPLRVPDDLSVPDESEALRVPPESSSAGASPSERADCLESPPDFFEGGVGAGAS